MIINIKGISKTFKPTVKDAKECQNVTIDFQGVERDITVELPITKNKIKEAVIRYWSYHKNDIKKEVNPMEGQQLKIPELDDLTPPASKIKKFFNILNKPIRLKKWK
jgi:hypothetical protein